MGIENPNQSEYNPKTITKHFTVGPRRFSIFRARLPFSAESICFPVGCGCAARVCKCSWHWNCSHVMELAFFGAACWLRIYVMIVYLGSPLQSAINNAICICYGSCKLFAKWKHNSISHAQRHAKSILLPRRSPHFSPYPPCYLNRFERNHLDMATISSRFCESVWIEPANRWQNGD